MKENLLPDRTLETGNFNQNTHGGVIVNNIDHAMINMTLKVDSEPFILDSSSKTVDQEGAKLKTENKSLFQERSKSVIVEMKIAQSPTCTKT